MSITALVILGGCWAFLLRRFTGPVTLADSYFHLRLGREFLEGWSLSDPGSVTRYATADWVPTQWLSQVGYAWIEERYGLPGVGWLAGTVCVAFVLVVALVARHHSSMVTAAFVTIFVTFSMLPYLSWRPQVFSYLFAVLVMAGWYRLYSTGKVPWWIVPLSWLWPLVHGMWVVGIVTSFVMSAGYWLDMRSDPATRRLRRSALAVPVLSCAAAALTPLGTATYTGVLTVGGISDYFDEWGPPDFTDPQTAVAGALVGWCVLILVRRRDQVPWVDVAALASASLWLAYSGRTIPVALALLVPLLARALQSITPARQGLRWEVPAMVVGSVIAVVMLAVLAPVRADSTPREDSAASQAVAKLPPGTGLLNEWAEGGIDMYLYPDLHVVAHGYGDMFTIDELERNVRLEGLEPEWDKDVEELGVEYAWLYRDSSLAYALQESRGWTVVEEDEEMALLRAPR